MAFILASQPSRGRQCGVPGCASVIDWMVAEDVPPLAWRRNSCTTNPATRSSTKYSLVDFQYNRYLLTPSAHTHTHEGCATSHRVVVKKKTIYVLFLFPTWLPWVTSARPSSARLGSHHQGLTGLPSDTGHQRLIIIHHLLAP